MSKKDDQVQDGLYMFYVKDTEIYPIAMDDDQWNLLQALGNTIAGFPIKVFKEPMGKVERLK